MYTNKYQEPLYYKKSKAAKLEREYPYHSISDTSTYYKTHYNGPKDNRGGRHEYSREYVTDHQYEDDYSYNYSNDYSDGYDYRYYDQKKEDIENRSYGYLSDESRYYEIPSQTYLDRYGYSNSEIMYVNESDSDYSMRNTLRKKRDERGIQSKYRRQQLKSPERYYYQNSNKERRYKITSDTNESDRHPHQEDMDIYFTQHQKGHSLYGTKRQHSQLKKEKKYETSSETDGDSDVTIDRGKSEHQTYVAHAMLPNTEFSKEKVLTVQEYNDNALPPETHKIPHDVKVNDSELIYVPVIFLDNKKLPEPKASSTQLLLLKNIEDRKKLLKINNQVFVAANLEQSNIFEQSLENPTEQYENVDVMMEQTPSETKRMSRVSSLARNIVRKKSKPNISGADYPIKKSYIKVLPPGRVSKFKSETPASPESKKSTSLFLRRKSKERKENRGKTSSNSQEYNHIATPLLYTGKVEEQEHEELPFIYNDLTNSNVFNDTSYNDPETHSDHSNIEQIQQTSIPHSNVRKSRVSHVQEKQPLANEGRKSFVGHQYNDNIQRCSTIPTNGDNFKTNEFTDATIQVDENTQKNHIRKIQRTPSTVKVERQSYVGGTVNVHSSVGDSKKSVIDNKRQIPSEVGENKKSLVDNKHQKIDLVRDTGKSVDDNKKQRHSVAEFSRKSVADNKQQRLSLALASRKSVADNKKQRFSVAEASRKSVPDNKQQRLSVAVDSRKSVADNKQQRLSVAEHSRKSVADNKQQRFSIVGDSRKSVANNKHQRLSMVGDSKSVKESTTLIPQEDGQFTKIDRQNLVNHRLIEKEQENLGDIPTMTSMKKKSLTNTQSKSDQLLRPARNYLTSRSSSAGPSHTSNKIKSLPKKKKDKKSKLYDLQSTDNTFMEKNLSEDPKMSLLVYGFQVVTFFLGLSIHEKVMEVLHIFYPD